MGEYVGDSPFFTGECMSVKVLHVADLHLDTPFKSLGGLSTRLSQQIQQATKQSFERLVDIAIKEKVDAVLIVGDAFNSAQPSVSAQLFFQAQLQRLTNAKIPVVMNFGNHDFYNNGLLIALPEGVSVLGEEVTTVTLLTQTNATLVVSGFSYYQQHITEVNWSQFPQKQSGTYHIGMLHGQMDGGVYAPFTIKRLASYGYDYWALGHIHQRAIVSQHPLVAYSGNIQGLHSNESGEKGGYLVTFNAHNVSLEEVNTASIIWKTECLEIAKNHTLDDVLYQIRRVYERLNTPECLYFVRFEVYYDADVSRDLLEALQQPDILEWGMQAPCYMVALKLNGKEAKKMVLLDDEMSRVWQHLKEKMTEDAIQSSTKALLQHRIIQHYFKDDLCASDYLKNVHEKSVHLIEEALGGDVSED